jgi:phospho-N-acetylmuramoyl-pentapeptide-transferase
VRAILFGGGLALLISLLGTRVAINVLTHRGYGQEIRDDGPTSHHTKRGTPTMGGVVIILATLLGYFAAKLITQDVPTASALLLLFLFVGCGLVGFLDDYIKVAKQRSLGLRSKAKMIGLTIVAVVFGGLALAPALEDDRGRTPASNHISFIRDFDSFALPTVLALVLIWVIITGTSNAVNLTDGLDGLATGASVMVFGAYTLVNIWQNNQWCGQVGLDQPNLCYEVRDPLDLAVIASAITGACFGFLWWNASPAAIFMGDTGSLALGGALAGFAILSRTELLLLVLGGLFVVVTLSVMIQVGVFKASRASGLFRAVFRVRAGHRVFRIAPIHHHFEMLGWEQVTVVIRFWIITGLSVAAGLGIFYAEWVAGT